MMSKINLLPWREEFRKIRNRVFYALVSGVIFLGIIVILMVHMILSHRAEVESANVVYLNRELKGINTEISQIQGLQESKENLLSRMQIIQALQEDRTSIVRLLDVLPRVVPDSVYLLEVNRSEIQANAEPEKKVTEGTALEKLKSEVGINEAEKKTIAPKKEYHVEVLGIAQTNTGISNFMKNLSNVKWISDIKYSEVAINKTGEGLNFKLEFTQKLTSRE